MRVPYIGATIFVLAIALPALVQTAATSTPEQKRIGTPERKCIKARPLVPLVDGLCR